MALADTARLAVQIDLEGNAAAGVSKLNRQVQGLGKSVGRMGRGVGQVGAGFARAGLVVGGAAIAGITAAGKAAVDFEDAFAGVRKTVDEADLKSAGLSFESLAKDFREMATEIPIAAVEFARIGEIAGALGVKAKDIKEFTRVTALMGVTTNLSADEAADAFGRIGTILGLTGDDYQELADSIVALGNAGASTESEITEITKRFAAEAKAAGLAKEDIVGLASATASLGFAPERGGTALARVFANMATNIALANTKGKAISRGIGRPIKELQRDINRGRGLLIFEDILETIRDMKPTDAARFLKSIGVTNVSDRTIFRTMADQLPFVNEQLEIARKSQGALLKEAEKKFATTASKIQIFKNNLIESGIAMGEQFLPAVGRALDKLTAAFKDPATKADIVQLGKDIGAALDDIDWANVVKQAKGFVGVLKGALSFTLLILEAINKLPTELKAAGAGFIALNKLSGGLIGSGVGNVVGGLAGAVAQGVASRAPGVGRLFAQPVFVTNWPIGGVGGGVGGVGGKVKGGLSALSKVFLIGEAIGLALMVNDIRQGISDQSTLHSEEIKATQSEFLKNKPSTEAIKNALAGVNQGIADITSNPLLVLVQGEALTNLRLMQAELHTALRTREGTQNPDRQEPRERQQQTTKVTETQRETTRGVTATKAAIEASKAKLAAAIAETKRETTRGVTATQAVRTAEVAGASRIVSATAAQTGAIVGAIFAARPIVNVTNVTRSTTIQQRYGPGNGSNGQPAHDLI